jgi:hypothetical protein
MAENNGKDPMSGRFLAGHKFGGKSPGSPVAKRMGELRRAILEATTVEQVTAAFGKLYEVAMTGDVPALALYLSHVVGRPKETVEISGPDGQGLSLATVVAVITEALGDDEAARIRVAGAFHRLSLGGPGGDPGGS